MIKYKLTNSGDVIRILNKSRWGSVVCGQWKLIDNTEFLYSRYGYIKNRLYTTKIKFTDSQDFTRQALRFIEGVEKGMGEE